MKHFTTFRICILTFLGLFSIHIGLAQESKPLPNYIKCSEEPTNEAIGVLTNTSASKPKMKTTDAGNLKKGDRGEMSKYFETVFLGANVTGWLGIGVVEVLAVKGNVVEFKVLEEQSSMVVNGKKKAHFEQGKQVKFSIYDYGESREVEERWTSGNLKARGVLSCGRKIGVWKYYNEEGILTDEYELNKKGEIDKTRNVYFPNGQLKSTITYNNGKEHGGFTTYFSSGKAASKGTYSDGDLVNDFVEWYENGNPKEKGKFYFGGGNIKNGLWITYYESGNKESEITYHRGKKNGECKYWSESGALTEEGSYRNNKKNGTWTNYFPSGNKDEEVEYSMDEKLGLYRSWYENGKLAQQGEWGYGGLKEKEWIAYYENGKVFWKNWYAKGKLNGLYESWYENGQKEEECRYQNGKPVGTYRSWYPSGRPHKEIMQEGSMWYKEWYENGQLVAEGALSSQNKMDGKWVLFYEDGRKKAKGAFSNGTKVGKWIEWDQNGEKEVKKY